MNRTSADTRHESDFMHASPAPVALPEGLFPTRLTLADPTGQQHVLKRHQVFGRELLVAPQTLERDMVGMVL